MTNAPKERLVVIGNYNHNPLSNVLIGSQKMGDIFLDPLAWYEENNIQLRCPFNQGFFALDDG